MLTNETNESNAMSAEEVHDFCHPFRRRRLAHYVGARSGAEDRPVSDRISREFVLEQAAERFFFLLEEAEENLRGRFTEEEFTVILDSQPGLIWRAGEMNSVATSVADNYGVESPEDVQNCTPLRDLLHKLATLSGLENEVLADVCERVWRGYKNPLL